MKNFMDDLLNKEMDRKEFLKFAGGAALILTGVTGVLKSLRKLPGAGAKTGFGGSYYGKTLDSKDS